jgi:spermidine/putrescine-binding protein
VVDSWQAVFDPRFAGRILMLDDMRECFAVALKSMGRSLNETDPAALAAAADLLKRQKRLVKTYNSGDFANILAVGDVDLAHGYNGQLAAVVRADPDRLAYAVPREGGTVWMDSVCIPAGARHLDSAYAFLDYLLEPRVAAAIVNGIDYASANAAARPFITPEILADPAIYPPDEVLDRCEFIDDLGETTTLLDRYWTEIKAQ